MTTEQKVEESMLKTVFNFIALESSIAIKQFFSPFIALSRDFSFESLKKDFNSYPSFKAKRDYKKGILYPDPD